MKKMNSIITQSRSRHYCFCSINKNIYLYKYMKSLNQVTQSK